MEKPATTGTGPATTPGDGLEELRGVWRTLAGAFPGLELVGLDDQDAGECWEQDQLAPVAPHD